MSPRAMAVRSVAVFSVLLAVGACSDRGPVAPETGVVPGAPAAAVLSGAASLSDAVASGFGPSTVVPPGGWSFPEAAVIDDFAVVTFSADESAFQARCPALPVEDFEEAAGVWFPFPPPLDENTNNTAFSPGEIETGLRITTDNAYPGTEEDLFTFGANHGYGLSSQVVIANYFVERFIIEFTDGPVTSVGGDLIGVMGGGGAYVHVYGSGGFLGGTYAPATPAGTFLSMESAQAITRIEVWDPANGSEGMDEIAFGNCEFLPVTLDVEPGDPGVELGRSTLEAALLTTPTFRAFDADPSTLTLGNGTGYEAPVDDGRGSVRFEDVDRDGDRDLLLRFDQRLMERAGDLAEGSVKLTLRGSTRDGRALRGTEEVTVWGRDDEPPGDEGEKERPRCFLWWCR